MEFARWIDSEANREEGGEHVNVGVGCGVMWGACWMWGYVKFRFLMCLGLVHEICS